MVREGRTRKLVRILRGAGMTAREIADNLELSTQAVYYHLDAIEAAATETGVTPEKGAGDGRDAGTATRKASK